MTLGVERLFPDLAVKGGTPFGMATDDQTLAFVAVFLLGSAALAGFSYLVKWLVGEDNWQNLDDDF